MPERDSFDFMTHTAPIWAEGKSARRVKTAAEALAKIMDNILEKPSILKYRRLPANGTAFVSRVVACPGALEVLKNVGFTTLTYPNGEYFVLHRVDEHLLRAALVELRVGLSAIEQRRVAALAGAADAGDSYVQDVDYHDVSNDAEEDVQQQQPQRQQPDSTPMPTVEQATMARQLQARSVVHRIAAREASAMARARWRWNAAIFALVVAVLGVALGAPGLADWLPQR